MPAQSFGIDQHLTILPVAAPPQLIHSQANAALSRIADVMATRLFYQSKKLHSLISGETNISLLRTAAHAHAERRTTGSGAQSLLLATNEPGSVLQACASSGQPQPLNYTAYGAVQAALSALQTLMFNGEWREPVTGCYHLGNGYRLFSPTLMRFYSFDTLSPFDKGGINGYVYCAGDPINFNDSDGHILTPISMNKPTKQKLPPATRLKALGRSSRALEKGIKKIELRGRLLLKSNELWRQARAAPPENQGALKAKAEKYEMLAEAVKRDIRRLKSMADQYENMANEAPSQRENLLPLNNEIARPRLPAVGAATLEPPAVEVNAGVRGAP